MKKGAAAAAAAAAAAGKTAAAAPPPPAVAAAVIQSATILLHNIKILIRCASKNSQCAAALENRQRVPCRMKTRTHPITPDQSIISTVLDLKQLTASCD
jgi:hypothetical protein